MQVKENLKEIQPQNIAKLLEKHYFNLLASFYETQSLFLSGVYKRYGGIKTANIVLCYARSTHLEIIRQRENNLNYNVSLENFWYNFQNVSSQSEKISSIVQITGIPKETVRRKVKNLIVKGFLKTEKNIKGYYWNLLPKHKDSYYQTVNDEIKILSKFTFKYANYFKLNLNIKLIEQEIKSQFSFYWYHFLSCQLQWLKMWQNKLKDNDLLLIVLQTIIPTLQYADKHAHDVRLDNIFKIIGKIGDKYNFSKTAVSASTVSEVTGIPRATCIRKLNKLVALKFLLRETKTKRYFVNQNIADRTQNIVTKDNVNRTIEIFGKYLAIILTSLVHNRNNVV